jgi:hypothetical protein
MEHVDLKQLMEFPSTYQEAVRLANQLAELHTSPAMERIATGMDLDDDDGSIAEFFRCRGPYLVPDVAEPAVLQVDEVIDLTGDPVANEYIVIDLSML